MPKINAIILHRTDSSTINGTLASFSKGIGAHFIVEKDGNIYRAASLFVYTSHVGKIKSRCKEEKHGRLKKKRK
ncbi:N-acetylmuramoyl-L-alanine amidase [Escherichia coli]|nr:N-acetylmuramoyl-L-alanine amidase [Escherichia coli]